MEALWSYQEAEVAKNAVEAEIRSTPARLQLNKLHKQLKNQQTVIAKLSEDIEAYEQQLTKLTIRFPKLSELRWKARACHQ
jgi:peptidoglycan hydrolase CwlO-like protein